MERELSKERIKEGWGKEKVKASVRGQRSGALDIENRVLVTQYSLQRYTRQGLGSGGKSQQEMHMGDQYRGWGFRSHRLGKTLKSFPPMITQRLSHGKVRRKEQ